MTPFHALLCCPNQAVPLIAHPYLLPPASPAGSRQPNGTIIVTDEAAPSLLYKFTPWVGSALAFDEIDAYARLRDLEGASGIVQLVGLSGTEEHVIRVMERSHRGSLDKVLRGVAMGTGMLDADLARSILADVAETMANIHALKLVHRDLKAENVLVFDRDANAGGGHDIRAKVSDFDRTVSLRDGTFLEEPVGSLFHMAPELLAHGKYDRKVDVYAFGILMFEVVHAGARPYANVATGMPGSLPRTEFSEKVMAEGYRPVWVHDDEALKSLAERCWAENPVDRPEFEEIAGLLKARSPRQRSPQPATTERKSGPAPIERAGIASTIGRQRRAMEDAACVLQTPDALVLGVFDGLRGSRTSTFAARRLALALADTLAKEPQNPDRAMRTAFETTEASLQRMMPAIECGSTATVAVLRGRDLFVSWLGDSPAFLYRKAEGGADVSPVKLVTGHHPDREDEATDVRARGGEIRREQKMMDSGELVPWGPLRVCAPESGEAKGGIALSRALGLFPFKPAVGSAPDAIRIERRDDDLFLVVGSDGVFEVLSPERVREIIVASPSAQDAAEAIIDAVMSGGAPDNAIVIVVDLREQTL